MKALLPSGRGRGPRRRPLPGRVLAAAGLGASTITRNGSSVSRTARRAAPGSIVLGIDPGTIVVGYAAVQGSAREPRLLAAGVIRPPSRAGVPERLGAIQEGIAGLLAEIRPAVVVVERAFASRNPQAALRIGEGRGVVLACAAVHGAEVVELTPAAAKKALVGHGAADKSQVARMVAAVLGLKEPPRPLDASDAAALALAHLFRRVDCRRDGGAARTRGAGGALVGVRGRSPATPA